MAPRPVTKPQLDVMVGTASCFLFLITIFSSFRAWDIFRRWKLGLHDVFAIISYLAASAMFCSEIYMYCKDLGVPHNKITPDRSAASARVLFVYSVTFVTALSFALLSFITFYWMLFATPICRRFLIVLFILEAANAIPRYFVAIFQCHPVSKTFNPLIHGKCFDRTASFAVANSIDFLTTSILFIIPIKMLWNMTMPYGKKAGIMFMLACGLAIVATLIISLYTIFETARGRAPPFPLLTSNIEIMVCILCLNMPSIYNIARLFPRLYRFLRLGDANNESDDDKPAARPETIGRRRVNRRPRETNLFSDGSLFSNWGRWSGRQWSRLSTIPRPATRAERPAGVDSPINRETSHSC